MLDTNQFFALENENNEPRKNSFEYDDWVTMIISICVNYLH